jgi:hypothetical protein
MPARNAFSFNSMAALLLAALALTACGDGLSKSRVERQVKDALSQRQEITRCMTRTKIKDARSNTFSGQIAENGFPVIFAEEAFIPWSTEDELIAILLLGEGYIAIHQGGYDRSMTEKGHPGALYRVDSYDDAAAVFADIRARGALVELTESGRRAGAWSDNNFCMTGRWDLAAVKNWTAPAADSSGRIVTHISADVQFDPLRLGPGKIANPLGAVLTRTVDMVSTRYADGWKIDDVGLD